MEFLRNLETWLQTQDCSLQFLQAGMGLGNAHDPSIARRSAGWGRQGPTWGNLGQFAHFAGGFCEGQNYLIWCAG